MQIFKATCICELWFLAILLTSILADNQSQQLLAHFADNLPILLSILGHSISDKQLNGTEYITKYNLKDHCDSRKTTCPKGIICHADASCVRSSNTAVYTCKCNIGFAGDGEDCGEDRDFDGWPDMKLHCCKVRDQCHKDNCPDHPNSGQEDRDDCHTPPSSSHTISPLGHLFKPCTPYKPDNCPTSDAWKTLDNDTDGHVDSCDNCPTVYNRDQQDTDHNHVGDACEGQQDTDGDRIGDEFDNCINVRNHDQSDIDLDRIGDKCDDDMDGDGIPNDNDNCPLVPNKDQIDTNNTNIGDVCENDLDGDCLVNVYDICPLNPILHKVDFRQFSELLLEPIERTRQNPPTWEIFDGGNEVIQRENSRAGLMRGHQHFSGVDYDGTFYVESGAGDDDYAGFIFGYQDSKTFYVVMWKQVNQPYFADEPTTRPNATAGIQLKKVNSTEGPSWQLADALWETGNTTDEVTLLWTDPNETPWEHGRAYRWQLIHRPDIGLIRFQFLTNGTSGASVIVDSGNIYDDEINDGYLGVYVHSQARLIFSNLEHKCNDKSVPQEVYDELPDDLKKKVVVDESKLWPL